MILEHWCSRCTIWCISYRPWCPRLAWTPWTLGLANNWLRAEFQKQNATEKTWLRRGLASCSSRFMENLWCYEKYDIEKMLCQNKIQKGIVKRYSRDVLWVMIMTVYFTAPHSGCQKLWSIMTCFNPCFKFNPVYTLKYRELNQYFTDIRIFRSDSNNKLSKMRKFKVILRLKWFKMILDYSGLFKIKNLFFLKF